MPAVIKLRLLVFLFRVGRIKRFQMLDAFRAASRLAGAASVIVSRHVDDMQRIPQAAQVGLSIRQQRYPLVSSRTLDRQKEKTGHTNTDCGPQTSNHPRDSFS